MAASAQRIATCVLAAAIAAGCAGRRAPDPAPDQVKVRVATVGVDSETGEHFVLLADESGNRTLPILIGDTEAQAIILELHGIQAPRPLTHDLLRQVIEQTGNKVDRVVIRDMRDQTYFAVIYLDRGRYRVDSRPSDAIALALGSNAPIYVANRLFEPGAAALKPRGTAEVGRGLGLVVQELTAPLASALGEQPRSGVVVSEAGSEAQKAGVERGDVVTGVGSQPVRSLKDFVLSSSASKPGESVNVTLRRGGVPQSVRLKVPAEHSAR